MAELLRAERLTKRYAGARTPALQDVSLTIARGETLGLVGESGCGKTTLGRSLMRLPPPESGRVLFDGQVFFDASLAKQPDAAPFRRRMQPVFQDAGASLDPRRTVWQAIAQALTIHRLCPERRERQERIASLMALVGLTPGQEAAYPHQLSGGQQQRVAIARALAVEPELLVCDEPVSALDLSIQAQILALLRNLQETMGLSLLFIGHDLSVVRQVSHRIAVMYGGRLVEEAPCEALLAAPRHPYTRALLAAVPAPVSAQGARAAEAAPPGEALREPVPGGCPYLARCAEAEASCFTSAPALRALAPGRSAACHLA